MAKPVRVQLRRTKGWRMPPNTVKVTRGKGAAGRFGNPFPIGSRDGNNDVIENAADAVRAYRSYIDDALDAEKRGWKPAILEAIRAELRGKNLACWCPLDAPCHADILLELANG